MKYGQYRKIRTKIERADFLLWLAGEELNDSHPYHDRTMELRTRIAQVRDEIGGSRNSGRRTSVK